MVNFNLFQLNFIAYLRDFYKEIYTILGIKNTKYINHEGKYILKRTVI